MSSEYVTIVEAHDHIEKEKINPIAKIIKDNKNKKLSFLQILIKTCNCTLNKKHQYITDPAGRIIKISQLFECLGVITTGSVRCIKCKEPVDWDVLPYHFEDHKLSLDQIYKLFLSNFQDFQYTNGHFWEAGVKIVV